MKNKLIFLLILFILIEILYNFNKINTIIFKREFGVSKRELNKFIIILMVILLIIMISVGGYI